jgi:hypothetical protein
MFGYRSFGLRLSGIPPLNLDCAARYGSSVSSAKRAWSIVRHDAESRLRVRVGSGRLRQMRSREKLSGGFES